MVRQDRGEGWSQADEIGAVPGFRFLIAGQRRQDVETGGAQAGRRDSHEKQGGQREAPRVSRLRYGLRYGIAFARWAGCLGDTTVRVTGATLNIPGQSGETWRAVSRNLCGWYRDQRGGGHTPSPQ